MSSQALSTKSNNCLYYSPSPWTASPTFVFLLFLLIRTANGCYSGYFEVESCGAVGEPTRVRNVFPKYAAATGAVNWGDEGFTRGFVAENNTVDGITVGETTDENLLILEHVYDQAGTYAVYFQITVYRNETIDFSNRCIVTTTEASIEVSENGCKVNFSAAMSSYSIWIVIIATAIGTAAFLN